LIRATSQKIKSTKPKYNKKSKQYRMSMQAFHYLRGLYTFL